MALERYQRILAGRALPAFHRSRSSGDLARKAEAAAAMMRSCALCEWRCGADRTAGKRGRCGVLEPRVTSEFLHTGEEAELVPSHTIFFSGCNFRCLFCQNHDISQRPERGAEMTPEEMADAIDMRWGAVDRELPLFPARFLRGGGRNVNFVGGEPTPDLPFILEALMHVAAPIPVVWNSNMYMTGEAMALLDGVVDLYLTDLKYGNDACAERLSGVKMYSEVVGRNHRLGEQHADLMIRHLVLPGHAECCSKPAIDWIADNLQNARVNIMDQYRPEWRAREAEGLDRRLKPEEFGEVMRHAREVLDPERFPVEPVL
ncbi:MAG: radical SAM protein [Thermoplasmata archaeon]|nr:radical SAM protein [Thermoplasmata archaeon]